MSNVATGPPTMPPQTIPAIAAATAIDGAPDDTRLLEQRRERETRRGTAGQRH